MWIRWFGIAVAVLGVLSLVVVYLQTRADKEQVDCHTMAMDQMHSDFYDHMEKAPGDPEVWGPLWIVEFEEWEQQMHACQERHH